MKEWGKIIGDGKETSKWFEKNKEELIDEFLEGRADEFLDFLDYKWKDVDVRQLLHRKLAEFVPYLDLDRILKEVFGESLYSQKDKLNHTGGTK